MARVVVVFDDLLLGSNLLGTLRAAGHDVELVGNVATLGERHADLLVVDLGSPAIDGIGLIQRLRAAGTLERARTLGVYSHIDAEARARAEAVGYDLVVPRSRMAREGAALVERLTASVDG